MCVFFVFVPFVASLLLVARPGAPSSLTYNYLEIVLFQSFWESLTWILAVRASASQCVCVITVHQLSSVLWPTPISFAPWSCRITVASFLAMEP